jgi:hypothetical protein
MHFRFYLIRHVERHIMCYSKITPLERNFPLNHLVPSINGCALIITFTGLVVPRIARFPPITNFEGSGPGLTFDGTEPQLRNRVNARHLSAVSISRHVFEVRRPDAGLKLHE